MKRVCFFGAYDPAYPRNRILRTGLESLGIEVREVRVAEWRAWRRYPALAFELVRAARDCDTVMVPEFRHKDVPLARLMRGQRRLVFDPLVSRHDTLVNDWAIHREGSPQAHWNRWLDRWSLSLPDLVLCDTWAHGQLFEALGVERARLRRVLVGAEDSFFRIAAPPEVSPLRVVYLGGFLPLHGVSVILEAAALLERRRLPDFLIELAGRGIEFDQARERAQRLALRRVVFTGAVRYVAAARVFGRAHVVLGAFGTSEKAGRVIPHKVWQGLAAGRAVVSGSGEGLLEVFEPGVHLMAVPRGDAESLAGALEHLLMDARERERLGTLGRQRALELGTKEQVARTLLDALEREREAA